MHPGLQVRPRLRLWIESRPPGVLSWSPLDRNAGVTRRAPRADLFLTPAGESHLKFGMGIIDRRAGLLVIIGVPFTGGLGAIWLPPAGG